MGSAKQQRPRQRALRVFVIIVLILLSGALALVYVVLGPKPGPRISVTCETLISNQTLVGADGSPTTRFLLQGQIIVTGPAAAVDQVVGESRDQGIELDAIKSCELSYRGARDLDAESFPFPPEALDGLTMRLYRIGDEKPVEEVIEAINEAGSERHVFADPNYLTGLFGQSACSDPHSPGASPHSPGASPFEVEGSPHSPGASPSGSSSQAAPELFWKQWAFEHIGAGLSLADALQATSVNPTGDGVRVGVFDTSPFTRPVTGGSSALVTIGWADPPFEMQVSHPAMPTLLPSGSTAATNINDHGLFVAGLVHAIAPESDIQLVRVINEYGCGDLYTLNEALLRFIEEVGRDRKTLDGAVINLSLGILKPRTADAIGATERQNELQVDEREMVAARDALEILEEDPIESLRAALLLARAEGIVVVAAAGNDSYPEIKPLPPQIPAQYPFVLGVAASNARRERACFSNWGDVSAPGGDGGPNEKLGLACASKVGECSGDCDEAVISLALSSPTDYAYWSGTSFSAPMVSGLAALVLENGVSGAAWMEPDEVFTAIRCGAPTPDGVINVPATLFRCMP